MTGSIIPRQEPSTPLPDSGEPTSKLARGRRYLWRSLIISTGIVLITVGTALTISFLAVTYATKPAPVAPVPVQEAVLDGARSDALHASETTPLEAPPEPPASPVDGPEEMEQAFAVIGSNAPSDVERQASPGSPAPTEERRAETRPEVKPPATPTPPALRPATPTPVPPPPRDEALFPLPAGAVVQASAPIRRITNVNVTFYDCADQGFCGNMANGRKVYEGAAACSYNLPLGTRFRIVGDPTRRVYTCEDRGELPNTWVDIFWYHPSDGWKWQEKVGRFGTIDIIEQPRG